jgi:hypothetical protein
MIEKDIVPYEESFELDKLGFDEPCFGWFYTKPRCKMFSVDEKGRHYPIKNTPKKLYTLGEHFVLNDDNIVIAPTFSQSFRFFRNKHNINAQIAFCEYSVSSENSWKFTFDNPTNVLIWNGKFNTYEEAELECLKVLIEMVKTK